MQTSNLIRLIVLSAAVTAVVGKKRRSEPTLTNQLSPPTSLSNAERREFLTEHNRLRSLVQPSAGNMLKMVYNV